MLHEHKVSIECRRLTTSSCGCHEVLRRPELAVDHADIVTRVFRTCLSATLFHQPSLLAATPARMLPHKIFNVADADGETVAIAIAELPGVRAENLGLKTWGAAWILANRISSLHKYVTVDDGSDEKLMVLEIGAGTGLSGLAAAVAWRCQVMLTDLPSIVDALEANVQLNKNLLEQRQSLVQSGTLDWFDPKHIYVPGVEQPLKSDVQKFQVILAADTLYSDDHPQLMADTIFEWLAQNAQACFIVCYAQRIAYLDHIRDIWRLLEQGGLHSIEEGLEHGDATWDEEAPFEWAVFKWKQFLPGV